MNAIEAFIIGLVCYSGLFCFGQNCLSGCRMPQVGLLHESEHREYCDQLRQTQACLWNRYEYCSHDEKVMLRPRLIDFQDNMLTLCDPNHSGSIGQQCLNEHTIHAKEYKNHCREIVSRYAAENPRSNAQEAYCLTLDARMNCMAMHIEQQCGNQAARIYKASFMRSMNGPQQRACKAYGFFVDN